MIVILCLPSGPDAGREACLARVVSRAGDDADATQWLEHGGADLVRETADASLSWVDAADVVVRTGAFTPPTPVHA